MCGIDWCPHSHLCGLTHPTASHNHKHTPPKLSPHTHTRTLTDIVRRPCSGTSTRKRCACRPFASPMMPAPPPYTHSLSSGCARRHAPRGPSPRGGYWYAEQNGQRKGGGACRDDAFRAGAGAMPGNGARAQTPHGSSAPPTNTHAPHPGHPSLSFLRAADSDAAVYAA